MYFYRGNWDIVYTELSEILSLCSCLFITSTEVMNNGYQQTYHSSKFIINGQTKLNFILRYHEEHRITHIVDFNFKQNRHNNESTYQQNQSRSCVMDGKVTAFKFVSLKLFQRIEGSFGLCIALYKQYYK
jgi:hypothetical protein